MVQTVSGTSRTRDRIGSAAQQLNPAAKKTLALEVIKRESSVTELSKTHEVSRKFLYGQANKAMAALDEAFEKEAQAPKVLFYLPVTTAWIKQLILALVLYCHSPFRGVTEVLRDLFDYPISVGRVRNAVVNAIGQAQTLNAAEDLSKIRVGGHDELFQHRTPVLAGMDLGSTYGYLLAREAQRDGETWAIHLLDAKDWGLDLDYTVADFGTGLRAGQAMALPDVPCFGDVFHILQDLHRLRRQLDKRVYTGLAREVKLEQAMNEAKRACNGRSLSFTRGKMRQRNEQAIHVADTVGILVEWMQHDILAHVGPDGDTRAELYDFVVAELQALEGDAEKLIGPVRRRLQNQRESLLAFARQLDARLNTLAEQFQISRYSVRQMLALQALPQHTTDYWACQQALHKQLHRKFYPVQQAVQHTLSKTFRASSMIENLNGRLRSYFSLRRDIGAGYLDLLRFFFNHRRYLRSRHPERVGKSPAELMTGQRHAHWLELLGFTLFKRTDSAAA